MGKFQVSTRVADVDHEFMVVRRDLPAALAELVQQLRDHDVPEFTVERIDIWYDVEADDHEDASLQPCDILIPHEPHYDEHGSCPGLSDDSFVAAAPITELTALERRYLQEQ
jgi:hypothetical protein